MSDEHFILIEGDDAHHAAYRSTGPDIDWQADDIVSELRSARNRLPKLTKGDNFESAVATKINVFNPHPFLLGEGESLPDEHALLTAEAEHCPIAFEAAKRLSSRWLRGGETLTPPLAAFAGRYMTSPQSPGRRPSLANRDRDFIITLWAMILSEKKGGGASLGETPARSGESAILILSEVFHVGPKMVSKIWSRNKNAITTIPWKGPWRLQTQRSQTNGIIPPAIPYPYPVCPRRCTSCDG